MVAPEKKSKQDTFAWWAHSKSHGWVVLDKSLAHNRNAFDTESFTFIRCRDWNEYEQADQPWNYKEAGRYLDSLNPAEALAAKQELAALQAKYAERL